MQLGFPWYVLFSNCFYMRMWPSRNHIIIVPKWGIPNVNDDLAEVNGLDPPTLPGSFLNKKEPGYDATPPPAIADI